MAQTTTVAEVAQGIARAQRRVVAWHADAALPSMEASRTAGFQKLLATKNAAAGDLLAGVEVATALALADGDHSSLRAIRDGQSARFCQVFDVQLGFMAGEPNVPLPVLLRAFAVTAQHCQTERVPVTALASALLGEAVRPVAPGGPGPSAPARTPHPAVATRPMQAC